MLSFAWVTPWDFTLPISIVQQRRSVPSFLRFAFDPRVYSGPFPRRSYLGWAARRSAFNLECKWDLLPFYIHPTNCWEYSKVELPRACSLCQAMWASVSRDWRTEKYVRKVSTFETISPSSNLRSYIVLVEQSAHRQHHDLPWITAWPKARVIEPWMQAPLPGTSNCPACWSESSS